MKNGYRKPPPIFVDGKPNSMKPLEFFPQAQKLSIRMRRSTG
jgi:hypothetical protein